jgi:hypothetical protein
MATPLVAIVGDANKAGQPELAKKSAADLGHELAKRGSRILVFSSDSNMIEYEVVRGYRESKAKKQKAAIEVRYSPDLEGRFPGETPGDPLFYRKPLGDEWEASFFPSLAEVDGLILVGGGYTTKVSGLIAIGARTPLLCLAGLGGAAKQVFDHLRTDSHRLATDDDLNVMAQLTWTPESASRCVDILFDQAKRRIELENNLEYLTAQRKRESALTMLALAGLVLFLLVLASIAEAWHSDQLSRSIVLLLFGTPALAGASGAVVRVVYDHWRLRQDAPPLVLKPAFMTAVLGFWASGVAGALFLLPQLLTLSTLHANEAARLLPFAAIVGLLAGLTLDKVFPKLTSIEIPLDEHKALSVNRSGKP